jgi:phosphinothricin acetyltransferase
VSVYTHAQARRSGVGRALYCSLFELLTLQGFYNCYAGITLPNPASVGLHVAMGFQPVGIYQAVGYKLGAWHDVGWWQRGLKPCLSHPDPPITFAVLRHTSPVWADALNAGLPFLRV